MKIRALGALSHADGLTDRHTDRHITKLIVALRKFANAPKKGSPRLKLLNGVPQHID